MDILPDHDLQSLNTLALPCRAQYFAEAGSTEDLRALLAWSKQHELPVRVLGGGSNVVLPARLSGLVVRNGLPGIEKLADPGASCTIRVGAGANWHETVLHCLAAGWHGLENLSLIPGSVGAAPIQNIGAYGVELERCLLEVEVLDVDSGDLRCLSREECRFGYRDSVFKGPLRGRVIITAVTFSLSSHFQPELGYAELAGYLETKGIEEPTAQQVSDAVIAIRSAKLPDPAEIGNAGSFFKNPIIGAEQYAQLHAQEPGLVAHQLPGGSWKLAAGWLIQQCGWRGRRIGPVGTYKNQALVLVHDGTGSVAQLLALADEIRGAVRDRFGVNLEIEPQVWSEEA